MSVSSYIDHISFIIIITYSSKIKEGFESHQNECKYFNLPYNETTCPSTHLNKGESNSEHCVDKNLPCTKCCTTTQEITQEITQETTQEITQETTQSTTQRTIETKMDKILQQLGELESKVTTEEQREINIINEKETNNQERNLAIDRLLEKQNADQNQILTDDTNKTITNDIFASKYGTSNLANKGSYEQSTQYNEYAPRFAFDGRNDTFNQTLKGSIENPSWLRVTLQTPVNIKAIRVKNRMGSYNIRSKISPFEIIIKEQDGSIVRQKQYNTVQAKYTWEEINTPGQIVEIKQLKSNVLHITELEIYGDIMPAKMDVSITPIKSDNIISAITNTSDNDADENLKLMISVASLTNDDRAKLEEERIKIHQKAIEKMEHIKKVLKYEEKIVQQAIKLNVPEPESRFKPEQIALVEDILEKTATPLKILTADMHDKCKTISVQLRKKYELVSYYKNIVKTELNESLLTQYKETLVIHSEELKKLMDELNEKECI